MTTALRRRVPRRHAQRPLLGLVQHALRLARRARPLHRGELARPREPRRSRSWAARASAGSSCSSSRRRSPSSSTLSRSSARRSASQRSTRSSRRPRQAEGSHVTAGVQVRLADADAARVAARDRHDQLLQLRLLRALHPLRDAVARRRAGDARPRPRRRRGRRADRRGRRRTGEPPDRRRAGVRARLRALPRAARARSARRRAAVARARMPLPGRVRLRRSAW